MKEYVFEKFEDAFTFAGQHSGCKMRFVAKIAKWIVLIFSSITAVVVIMD